jgi:hypothetical protein
MDCPGQAKQSMHIIVSRVRPLAAFSFAKKDVDSLAFRMPRVGAHGLEHGQNLGSSLYSLYLECFV